MTLTPEMEALVPEVSRELFKALTGGRAGKPKLIDLAAARAIIPLIYTAGLRAGREEAAKVAEAAAQAEEEAGEGGGREWATAKSIATSIRNLSGRRRAVGDELTLTVGPDATGRKLAIITTGGHPQRPGSGECEVLEIEVVDGWGKRKIADWYSRMLDQRPWETRQ